ncbi:hypothetical protein I4F81_009878 [Pyropia yezoensis]|uniref:Uncharacterized protein n=1 Tax=Pyropia yezoensis TaxID=2788 RepID=A0ACC3CBK9_PYRYE|nr:hypothetical protein I4F81_009878 [Neopyropia yezoensis]
MGDGHGTPAAAAAALAEAETGVAAVAPVGKLGVPRSGGDGGDGGDGDGGGGDGGAGAGAGDGDGGFDGGGGGEEMAVGVPSSGGVPNSGVAGGSADGDGAAGGDGGAAGGDGEGGDGGDDGGVPGRDGAPPNGDEAVAGGDGGPPNGDGGGGDDWGGGGDGDRRADGLDAPSQVDRSVAAASAGGGRDRDGGDGGANVDGDAGGDGGGSGGAHRDGDGDGGDDGRPADDNGTPSTAPPIVATATPMSTLTVCLYDVSSYTFGTKDRVSNRASAALAAAGTLPSPLPSVNLSAHSRGHLPRERKLALNYAEQGMRRTVAGVLLVQSRRFAHVLLLQNAPGGCGTDSYALPGGRLRPGESDTEGLLRKLTDKLAPAGGIQWEVGDQLSSWWATDFTNKRYPYVPAHVTRARERLNVYVVQLPASATFAVPRELTLVAVPLFEIYNNARTYGDVIAAVAVLLSRFHLAFMR